VACPELLSSGETSTPDIRIREGEVPAAREHTAREGLRWQAAPGLFLMDVEGLARFQARDGAEITIQRVPGAREDSIRSFLLGACLSILLHQRRLFVLHCSGVDTARGAVLFAGRSGSGKSTMVSAFLERGCKILADDMLALTFNDGGQVIALPGFPQVKLPSDSARALGRSTEGLRRVIPEEDRFVSPELDRFSSTPRTLHAIYELRVGDGARPALTPLAHTPRFNTLLDHTWQKATMAGLGVREWHFHTAARIAAVTYMARLTRTSEPLDIQLAADLIQADMQREHALS